MRGIGATTLLAAGCGVSAMASRSSLVTHWGSSARILCRNLVCSTHVCVERLRHGMPVYPLRPTEAYYPAGKPFDGENYLAGRWSHDTVGGVSDVAPPSIAVKSTRARVFDVVRTETLGTLS